MFLFYKSTKSSKIIHYNSKFVYLKKKAHASRTTGLLIIKFITLIYLSFSNQMTFQILQAREKELADQIKELQTLKSQQLPDVSDDECNKLIVNLDKVL